MSLRACTQRPNVKRDLLKILRLSDSEFVSFFFCQQKVTKGARHKIVISILKLKERQHLLRSLEKVSVQQSPSSTQKKTDLFGFHISFQILHSQFSPFPEVRFDVGDQRLMREMTKGEM